MGRYQEVTEKLCLKCNKVKPRSDFANRTHRNGTIRPYSYCKPCVVQINATNRMKRLGLNVLSAPKCEICKKAPGTCADHDHSCCRRGCANCFRGFLCHPCNQTLGLMNESPARLRAAAQYLERTSNPVARVAPRA